MDGEEGRSSRKDAREMNERGSQGCGEGAQRDGNGEEGYKKKTYKTLLNGCSVKNAMSARPVNLPVSKLTVTRQSEPSPRSGKQPFKRHKQKKRTPRGHDYFEGTDKKL